MAHINLKKYPYDVRISFEVREFHLSEHVYYTNRYSSISGRWIHYYDKRIHNNSVGHCVLSFPMHNGDFFVNQIGMAENESKDAAYILKKINDHYKQHEKILC